MARRADFRFENREPEQANFRFEKEEPIKAIFKISPPTVNYELLIRKPKINHIELIGDKSLEELGIVSKIDELIEQHNTSEDAHEFIRNLIAQEVEDRIVADGVLGERIDSINSLIPAEATSSNQLADKDYVLDLVKANGASYRGSWATWAAVPTNANEYPEDAQGDRTPNANDYMVVIADETQDGGTWMYKYTGNWATDGKNGWLVEYEIEKAPFTPEQQAAIDSGITSTLVEQISTNQGDISDINTIIGGYGDIVTHDVSEFATAVQGAKADTALQPNDNISELNNDAGYTSNVGTVTSVNNIEPVDGNVTIEIPDTATWGNITGTLSNQTDLQTALDGKVDKYSTMPAVTASDVGKIAQFVGTTNYNYTNGYFYKVVEFPANSVTFTPLGDTTTVVSVDPNDFAAFVRSKCTGDIDRGTDGTDITHGRIGIYSSTRYSFSASTPTRGVFALSFEISELEAAGFTFTPPFGAQQGVDYICTISTASGYGWQRIDVQPATDISGKVDKLATSPTAGTYTKVTINNEGLVSEGTTLQASDIPLLTLSKISDVTATATELNVLDGITATTAELNYTDGVTSNIQTQFGNITDKIPSQASSSNQLADKEFVNSSIATNTANFIGTFENETLLEAYTGTVTNNDYAFVINSVVTDNGNDWATFADLDAYSKTHLTNMDYAWVVNGSNFDLYRFDIVNQEWISRATNVPKNSVTLNTAYNRYKATVTNSTVTWEYEYTLNNSSFTAAQWAAINSGITSGDVALIETALQPNDDITNLNNNAGYISGINSTDVTTALGYTPYDNTNPNGYTTNVGTVTSVNNTTPDASGDVTLPIPTAGTGLENVSNQFNIVQETNSVTVVGTLTNNNGVFSGFSPSNYLLLNPNTEFTDYTENASSWEVVFKFTYAASNPSYNYGGKQMLYTQGASYGCSFGVANDKLVISLSNTDGVNSIGARGGATTLVAGNTYWYKAEFTGSAYKMYLSTNGTDYTQEGTDIISSTRLTPRGVWAIGRCVNGASDLYSYAWQGSIDINNSYIKMNNEYWWKGSVKNVDVAKATSGLYGLVKPDNTTITVSNGVISAVQPTITFYWGE